MEFSTCMKKVETLESLLHRMFDSLFIWKQNDSNLEN